MIEEIIAILEGTGLPVKPFNTNTIEECICYRNYLTSFDGVVEQYRLEIRIIAFTLAKAEDAAAAITKALVTVGDASKNGMNSCALNGGGCLADASTQTIHKILYFNYIKGVENND